MCDTRQRDGSTETERDEALTQVPLQDSAENKSNCEKDGWRKIAKLAEMETDPDRLMDLAQQLVNELDRDAATNALPSWNNSAGVSGTPEAGK